jgi:hypothetical protein
VTGTDPHYGERDPRQQDLPDPHSAKAGPATACQTAGRQTSAQPSPIIPPAADTAPA